jgi:diaminopimelate decarboxylase
MSHALDLIRRTFACRDGKILAGGVPVRDIADEHGTPLFIYDRGVIERKLGILRTALGKHFTIYYSVKANPSRAVISLFLEQGCGLEVASGGELFQALEAGCQPSQILFAGPGKSFAELEYAIRSRVGEIHIESRDEIGRIEEIGHRQGVRVRVGIRINPTSEAQGGAMQMGGKASPFGIDEEELDDAVARLSRSETLELCGVHLFSGTQILDFNVLVRQYRKGLHIAQKIADIAGKPLRTIDFGGGFGIPYFPGEAELDVSTFGREVATIVDQAKKIPAFAEASFIVEPGRYLVGESGIYVSRVNTIKTSRGKKFVVVDGGLNHHLAASGNFGQVIKKNFPIVLLNKWQQAGLETVDIVGPLCTPLDMLGRNVNLPPAEVGDLLGIFQSGAYARSASPMSFLSHPSPPEILVADGEAHLIRRRGKPGDFLFDQIVDGSHS